MSDISDRIEEIFLNIKPCRALIAINNPMTESYASQISNKIDSTYAHTVKILKKLDEAGLIERNDQGRKMIAETTERGRRVARAAQTLRAEAKDQSVQEEFYDAVFQGEHWNIVEADNGLHIDCLETDKAPVYLEELENAISQIRSTD